MTLRIMNRLNSRAYRGLTCGFLLLRNFSVAISVSPHFCFILVLKVGSCPNNDISVLISLTFPV